MSKTLMRGLQLLEAVDFHRSLTVSELARQLGWDKATVSRVVAACEADGWLERDGGQISVGARASLLGRTNAVGVAQRDADLLVHALSGVTGLIVQAYALVGTDCAVLASAGPRDASGEDPTRHLMSIRVPLWATAAGKVIASQLTEQQRDSRLPAADVPDSRTLLDPATGAGSQDALASYRSALPTDAQDDPHDTTRVTSRAALERQLAEIARDGVFVERREVWALSACVAVPWARPGVVGALAALATVDAIDTCRALVERALRAATRSGATRESIVAAAAADGHTDAAHAPRPLP